MNKRPLISDKRRFTLSAVYGFALSAAIVFGHQMEHLEHLEFTFVTFGKVLLLGVLITIAVSFLLDRLHRTHSLSRALLQTDIPQQDKDPQTLKRYFLKVWAGLTLCQIPVFLGVFPGFFVYDASDELYQVITRNFTTHHPLIHVLTMGGTVQAVYKLTGSYNAGIAVYIGLQAILICAAFALVLVFLKAQGVKRWVRILSFLFLGIFPPIVMFTLCSAKDGIFSAAFLLFEVGLLLLAEREETGPQKKGCIIFFIAITVVMLLYRNNAVYAYAVFLPFAIRAYRKRAVQLLILPLVLAIALNASLAGLTHAQTTNRQEMLTVPIQQLARLHCFQQDAFTEEELETLYRYLPEDSLKLYRPRLSDPVKIGFDNAAFAEDAGSFLRLWASTGKRHPVAYLNAWLMTSYGFWYPQTVINVYQGNTVYTFTYEESSYFGYEVEWPGTRTSFLPTIDELYKTLSIRKAQQEIPVVSLFFSPAFYFWMLAFAAVFLLTDEDPTVRRRTLFFLPLFLYWLTLLLGPTFLLRYVVILLETTVLLPVLVRRPYAQA